MSHNQDATTTTIGDPNGPTTTIGQNQDTPTTTVVVTTTADQNTPVVTIPCQDQNCSDPGFITTTTTATVAETVDGSSGELPATGTDAILLGGAAFCFVAFGVVLGRIAQREHKGLARKVLSSARGGTVSEDALLGAN